MAGSRLPNFGTIFTRVTGLWETGAIKELPIWYNVYKKYPPELEPFSDRSLPPQNPIPEIVYEEDFERVQKLRRSKKDTKGTKANSGQTSDSKVKSKVLDDIINVD